MSNDHDEPLEPVNRIKPYLESAETSLPAPNDTQFRVRMTELAGDPHLLFLDGFDDCVVGLCHAFGQPVRVQYDIECILDALVERHGLTEDEASEHFDFNIMGGYHGPYTPVFLLCHD